MIRQTLLVAMTLFTMWWLFDGNTKAEKMPPVLETGILGSGACWYDTERLIVVKRSPFRPGEESEVEGLYVVTPSKPREAIKINLAPVEPEMQKQIGDVSCHNGTILFSVLTSDKKRSRLYGIKVGGHPEVLAEMRGAMPQNVSMKGKYVLGNSRLATQGMFEGNDDCEMVSIKPGFRVICTDAWLVRRWPLTQYILTEYKWFDTIKIRGPDGQPKVIPNPEKQLTDQNGKLINYALFVRDFKGEILTNLIDDPVFAPWVYGDLVFTSDESFMYAACSIRSNPIGLADGVCRRRLNVGSHWEEVFRSEIPRKHKASISNIKVGQTGDIYFIIGGTKPPYHGVWKYQTATKQVTQLTNPGNFYDTPTAVSPDSRWVVFVRTGIVGNTVFLVQGGRNDNH